MTHGICYGLPGWAIPPVDGDSQLEELYEAEKRKVIESLAKKEGLDYWKARGRIVPEYTCEGARFLGFFLACGASGKDGVDDLKGFRLLDVEKRYAKPLKAATKAWDKFAAWCAKRGVELPPAELWLVECEVA
jgi:hypothetical protein